SAPFRFLTPQLRQLPVAILLDATPLEEVILLRLLVRGEVVGAAQAVLVQDLELGELGLGLLAHLGHLLALLRGERLLAWWLDAARAHALEGELVGGLELLLVGHLPGILLRAAPLLPCADR